MSSKPLDLSVCIEVCVDSLESAVEAVAGGASRLEICGNLGIGGGTTPSLGLVKAIEAVCPNIALMVMIRPRAGDFVYSQEELMVMLEDIECLKQEKITGIAIGVLRSEGTIDIAKTRILVERAKPMEVCFHRAFDMTRDPIEALKDVSSVRDINRVLTSGHGKRAPDSLEVLTSLAELSLTLQPPITILPGAGINAETAAVLVNCDWWKEFREIHLSAGRWLDGSMIYRKDGFGMGLGGMGEWGVWRSDRAIVNKVRTIAEAHMKDVNLLLQCTLLHLLGETPLRKPGKTLEDISSVS